MVFVSDFAEQPGGLWAAVDRVPRDLALVYDFANTRDERVFHPHSLRTDRRDLIEDAAALRDWLAARGLDERVTPDDVSVARELRSALRAAIRGTLDPAVRPEAAAALDAAASRLPLRVRLDDAGRPELAALDGSRPKPLSAILVQAAHAASRGDWTRLKMCAADDCRWIFYDASRPRTGRWCDMAVCGNRVKTRAYRERKRLPGPEAGGGV